MIKNIFIFILFLTVSACVKDKPVAITPTVQLSNSKKVYVINEGNFMSANASISLYDPGTVQVVEDFYKNQNNLSLGDVAQSISFFNSNFYIVINNSGKIVVCDNQFKYKNTINTSSSPRYFLPVSNSKAYVSDYKFTNQIGVLNLNTNTFTTSIPCRGWTEKMVLIYNKVFVTNMSTNYIYVINAINDTKSDSIPVGPNTGNILIDKNDNIWALSSGSVSPAVNATLRKINPVTNSVTATFTFAAGNSPGNLCANKTKDTLYFLNNGIFKMAISDLALPANPIINGTGKSFYGLGINPNDFTIYAADAIDYIQKSKIYIFDVNGNPKGNFLAGINSNGFYFE